MSVTVNVAVRLVVEVVILTLLSSPKSITPKSLSTPEQGKIVGSSAINVPYEEVSVESDGAVSKYAEIVPPLTSSLAVPVQTSSPSSP